MSTSALGHCARIVLKPGIGMKNLHETPVSSVLFAVWISCYFGSL
jgi:hypothetical protein